MAELHGKLSGEGKLSGGVALSGKRAVKGSLTTPEAWALIPEYDGVYEVTPTTETQTLVTSGFRMSGNVVVNPIPSNYGLITWDGTTLTVS